MLGKVIDIDTTDAFISFDDGTTVGISLSTLPNNLRVGDSININSLSSQNVLKNNIINNFFI